MCALMGAVCIRICARARANGRPAENRRRHHARSHAKEKVGYAEREPLRVIHCLIVACCSAPINGVMLGVAAPHKIKGG